MKNDTFIQKVSKFPMTSNDLRQLGVDDVGYIKEYVVKNEKAWVLHAADGTALAVQKDMTAAQFAADHQDIHLVSLH